MTEMRWMNPIYVGLRHVLSVGVEGKRDLIALNLERARALPASRGRYIIVNASAAELTMYEDGQRVDSMRVVVGKPIYPTPVMAAMIRYASLNPYWNVPPDLAAERIAPNVVKDGNAYLKLKGVAPAGRLEAAGTWNSMVTLRVRVGDPKQLDAELLAWLRQAYEAA